MSTYNDKTLKGVADAVKSGRLKYDPFTRKVSKLW
jgi:hypothetical protein